MPGSGGNVVQRLLPGAGRLRRYERRDLPRDALAGITVAAYLVPQVMGYATVAGLPVVTGLWAIISALTVYVLVGSSPQLSVGPESTTALMTAVALGPLAAGDAARYAALAGALALVVGAICVIARIARLGFLANLLSKPVLIGYMAGIAVLMIVGQLSRLTGVSVEGDSTIDHIRSFVEGLEDIHGATAALGFTTLAVMVVVGHYRKRWPVPLLGVMAATAVVAIWSLDEHGIALVGEIPAGFPDIGVPDVSRSDVADLLLPAVGIAVVSFTDNVLTARSFARRHRAEIDPNQELIALGAANAATGLTSGFPVSSSGSRTAIADSMGSTSSMASIVAVAAVIGVLLVGRDLLAAFPSAALGAVVVYAALKLVDIAGFRQLAHFRTSELLLALGTTAAVLAFDVLYGVLVAVGLSIVDLIRRVARPHDGVLGYAPGVAGMHDIDDYPDAELVPGLIVYRYDSPLFFANAEDFRRRALDALDVGEGPVRWFVLNAEANSEIDTTALDALVELHNELVARDIVFAMARVKDDLRQVLERAGFVDLVGPDRIYPTLPTAVDAFHAWTQSHP